MLNKSAWTRVFSISFGMLWLLPLSLAGAHDREGWGRHYRATSCEQSASSMRKACYYDVGDDLFTTLANCRNIGDRDERGTCSEEARTTRREDAESCAAVYDARVDACELLDEDRYEPDPLLNPLNSFIDPNEIPGVHAANPYVSLAAGHTYVLHAGEEGEETVVVHVTEDTREILGVACRVVADVVVEVEGEGLSTEYEAVEVTDDWFAQDLLGNVFYCGELARNFEDGVLRDIDGSFEAGRDYAKSGELIRIAPGAEQAHRQEFSLNEAEDIVLYLDTAAVPTDEEGGENGEFPCVPGGCLKTLEFSPLEPDVAEFKYYLPGTGFVLAVAMEDDEFTGEREELVCVGDSLDVLDEPSCDIDNPTALRDELCRLSPDAFCLDD